MGKPQNAVGIRLHAFQREMVSQARNVIREGQRRVLIVSETGSGKTVMGMELASHLRGRGLWLAHRTFLRDQAEETRRRMGLEGLALDVRMVWDGSVSVGAYDWIVVDEAHHAAAKSWRGAMESGKVVVGLTATPHRMDGVSMREAGWEAMVKGPRLSWLMDEGYLDRPEVLYNFLADQSGYGMLAPDKLAELVAEEHRGRTLVFAESLEAAAAQRGEMERLGLAAAVVAARDGQEARAERLAGLMEGTLPVVINYGVLTEGYDLPELDLVVINRATASLALYRQMAGRAFRKGSRRSRILDVGGSCQKVGIEMLADMDWDLEGGASARDVVAEWIAEHEEEARSWGCEPPPPRVGSGRDWLLVGADQMVGRLAWERVASSPADRVSLHWGRAGEYPSKKAFGRGIGVSEMPVAAYMKRMGVEGPEHWPKARACKNPMILDSWHRAPEYRSRRAFALAIGVSEASVKSFQKRHGVEYPAHWRPAKFADLTLRENWHKAEEYDSMKAFARAMGVSPKTVINFQKRTSLDFPIHWPKAPDSELKLRENWHKAPEYRSLRAFALAIGVVEGSVKSFQKRHGVEYPAHWRTAKFADLKLRENWHKVAEYRSLKAFALAMVVSVHAVRNFMERTGMAAEHWRKNKKRSQDGGI